MFLLVDNIISFCYASNFLKSHKSFILFKMSSLSVYFVLSACNSSVNHATKSGPVGDDTEFSLNKTGVF